METKIKFMTLLLSVMALCGCSKEYSQVTVTDSARAALLAKYPDASNIRWTVKANRYCVANFSLSATRAAGDELAAWFDTYGAWYMTETDISYEMLPEAVRTSFEATEYFAAPYTVCDVDMLEREGFETIYVIEVESIANGISTYVDLYYSEDGVLVKTILDSASDYDYGDYFFDPNERPVSYDYKNIIEKKYPGARIIEIDHEKGMTEVEIIDGRTPRELLFDTEGQWLYTKTEVHRNDVPEMVMTALQNSEYSSYRIDDIDHYVTKDDKSFYRFDLDSAKGDVTVDIDEADGTLTLKEEKDNWQDDKGQLVNGTVQNFIATKYPNADIIEYDYDDGLLEVEIRHDGRKKSVYFNGRNEWVYTEWDIRKDELPEAVLNTIKNSEWFNYEIDDIDYIQIPYDVGDYYQIEMERGKDEVKLRITEDGVLLNL